MKYTFIDKKNGENFEYHLPINYQTFSQKNIFEILYQLDTEAREDLGTFLYEKAILHLGINEYSLLYVIMLEYFAKNNGCYLVYFGEKEEICQMQANVHSNKCEWRFSIEFTRDLTMCNSCGFVNPKEFLDWANYFNKDLSSRYFYLAKIERANLKHFLNLYHTDVTNWFFIFLPPEKEAKIKETLQNTAERPVLADFLHEVNCTVNIQVGGDEGYLDYVLIQSLKEMNPEIVEIERLWDKFMKEYRELLEEVGDLKELWQIEHYKTRLFYKKHIG